VKERTAPSRAVERLPRSFELDARGQAIRRLAAIWPEALSLHSTRPSAVILRWLKSFFTTQMILF